MKRLLACALMALLMLITPAMAFLAFGADIVHDPISYANALLMLAELIKNYEQLKAQLELQTWMSQTVPVDMSLRYRVLGTTWYGMQLPYDRFGNLSQWADAVNQGVSAGLGYDSASIPLQPYGPAFSHLAADQQTKVMSQYASAELADGSNIHSMETLGMLRGNAPFVDESIQALEDDSLSLDPAMEYRNRRLEQDQCRIYSQSQIYKRYESCAGQCP